VGARFSVAVQTGPGSHSGSDTMGAGSFPGIKRSGHDVNQPLPSSAEVKERVVILLRPPHPLYSAAGHKLNFTF